MAVQERTFSFNRFSGFSYEIAYSFLVSIPFASLSICSVKSFSYSLIIFLLFTAISNVISFTFSGLGFRRYHACALVTTAATTSYSGFRSVVQIGLLAPVIFRLTLVKHRILHAFLMKYL